MPSAYAEKEKKASFRLRPLPGGGNNFRPFAHAGSG